jgi:hypothetical protein
MADASHVQQPHLRSSDEQPWQLVTRRTWHRVTRLAPPPVPRRLVPSDIVGHCFNGLRIDHVAAACTHPPCYLCCHREGHLARACKRPRTLDADDPLT